MKWPGKKNKKIPHLWDFEGRCEECAMNLILRLVVINQQKIILEVEECVDHPGSALLLYPQRDDVIRYPNQYRRTYEP